MAVNTENEKTVSVIHAKGSFMKPWKCAFPAMLALFAVAGSGQHSAPPVSGASGAKEYVAAGDAYRGTREYYKAIEKYSEALRLDPNSAAAHVGRGAAYAGKGDYKKAAADYDRALALDSASAGAELYVRRAQACNKGGGKRDKAMADYDRALALDPNDMRAYFGRGLMHDDNGDYESAIADYTEAIRLDSGFAIPYYNLGNAYFNKGDADSAIANYGRAISVDSNFCSAYRNRGFAYRKTGNAELAVADFTDAIWLCEDAGSHYLRGLTYLTKNDIGLAAADFAKAATMNWPWSLFCVLTVILCVCTVPDCCRICKGLWKRLKGRKNKTPPQSLTAETGGEEDRQ
jgi:tetratricopeptide (TPR) repeat protein